MEIKEDIHKSLKTIFCLLDQYCKANGVFYDLVDDEPIRQGYLFRQKEQQKGLTDYFIPYLDDLHVLMNVDGDRKDGVLFTFDVQAITDDGHCVFLTEKDKQKKHNPKFSPLPNSDAERVRRGDTMYQGREDKKPLQRLDELLEKPIEKTDETLEEILDEDQYKFPSGKHRRVQAPFRSSFGVSKTFGGRPTKSLSESLNGQPLIREPGLDSFGTSIGLTGAGRSSEFSPGEMTNPEKRRVKSPRKNIADLANLSPPPLNYERADFNAELEQVPALSKGEQLAQELVKPTDAVLDTPVGIDLPAPRISALGMPSGIRNQSKPPTLTGGSAPISNVAITPGSGGAFMPPKSTIKKPEKSLCLQKFLLDYKYIEGK